MRFREKMQQFMYGRYGNDQLSRVYLGITLVLLVLSLFTRWTIFYIAGIVLRRLLNKAFKEPEEEENGEESSENPEEQQTEENPEDNKLQDDK